MFRIMRSTTVLCCLSIWIALTSGLADGRLKDSSLEAVHPGGEVVDSAALPWLEGEQWQDSSPMETADGSLAIGHIHGRSMLATSKCRPNQKLVKGVCYCKSPYRKGPCPRPSGCRSAWVKRGVALTNGMRSKRSAPALKCNAAASAIAKRHSESMCKSKQLTHDGFDSRCSKCKFIMGCAENVAYTWDTSATAPLTVMKMWQGSKGHYDNIMNRQYRQLGMGFSKCNDGSVMWTQIFG